MAFLANGDNYAAAPLIINIAKDLNLTVSVAAMSVTAYMLSFGVFTLIFGVFAFNLPSLIFCRAMNGAFGAGIFPVTMALVGQSFDNENRHKALGKVMGLMFLGGAVGTNFNGIIMETYGVSRIFLNAFLLLYV